EEAMRRLEEASRGPAEQRRPPEFGSDKDFQLTQALNQLKGRPVLVSKTQTARPEAKAEN
ncbi:MAG: peptidase S41, partial [Betaproteobacteria bacterium]